MIDRRELLLKSSSAAFVLILGTDYSRAAAREQTAIIRQTAVAVGVPQKPFEFALFYDLSRFITARSNLDLRVARMHFEHFSKEEWGWVTAAKLYSVIHEDPGKGFASVPELLAANVLPDLEQWFAQHILDAWYEGIYRYDGAEVRVTFEDALMWEVVRGIVPIQGLSTAEYGFWAEPPAVGDGK